MQLLQRYPFENLDYGMQRRQVQLMMNVLGRLLVAGSQLDASIQEELGPLPEGFVFRMDVYPNGPTMMLQKSGGKLRRLASSSELTPDLVIRFKHITVAWLVMSFQENTAVSYAHDRVQMNGDTAQAIRIVRCMNRAQSIILPSMLGKKAIKTYVSTDWRESLPIRIKLVLRLLWNTLPGRG